jgi:hypothetical protein
MDRDCEILRWVGRHGLVTREQIAHRFFGRGGGQPQPAAHRRIARLEELGLVQIDNWFWREAQVVRLTGAGAAVAAETDPDSSFHLGPARLVRAEIRHSLSLVDLVEGLLEMHPGATFTTERELRAVRRRELRDGQRKARQGGRTPDGLLHLPDGQVIALELDTTDKRSADYVRIIEAYKQEPYPLIWWYVSPAKVKQLTSIKDADRWAAKRIEVGPW